MHIAEGLTCEEHSVTMASLASATSDRSRTSARRDANVVYPIEICAGTPGPLFRLHVLGARICVEQRLSPAPQCEVACYAIFDDEAQFLLWCDAHGIRLSHPLVHRQLRQAGCGLLSEQRVRT